MKGRKVDELMYLSGLTAQGCWDQMDAYNKTAIMKFAELIVNECADLYTHDDVTAPVGQSAYGEAYQDGWIEGTRAYRETIIDHFGVK
jgi:hypothetical protein